MFPIPQQAPHSLSCSYQCPLMSQMVPQCFQVREPLMPSTPSLCPSTGSPQIRMGPVGVRRAGSRMAPSSHRIPSVSLSTGQGPSVPPEPQ